MSESQDDKGAVDPNTINLRVVNQVRKRNKRAN